MVKIMGRWSCGGWVVSFEKGNTQSIHVVVASMCCFIPFYSWRGCGKVWYGHILFDCRRWVTFLTKTLMSVVLAIKRLFIWVYFTFVTFISLSFIRAGTSTSGWCASTFVGTFFTYATLRLNNYPKGYEIKKCIKALLTK